MRPNALVIFLIACSVVSCGTAPRITIRVVDPVGFVKSETDILAKESKESDGITCVSPDDTYRLFRACKLGVGVPDVVTCNWFTNSQLFGCSDGSIAQVEERVNWVCLIPRHWEMFVTYCSRRASDES